MHFYKATAESVPAFSVTVWYGNTTALERGRLEVRTASEITGGDLPTVSFIYPARSTAESVLGLFHFLPSGERFECFKFRKSRLRNCTHPEGVRYLNSHSKALLATEQASAHKQVAAQSNWHFNTI